MTDFVLGGKPVLVSMLGHAGSGKSYFAKQLAPLKGLVRLNADSFRLAMFGSVEVVEALPLDIKLEKTFKALDYVIEQILGAGHSVIYDANSNSQKVRNKNRELAERHGAISLVVWIKTSVELALERAQTRPAQADQRQFSAEKAQEVIDRHRANTDEPEPHELVIEIDGTIPFETQLTTFENQLTIIAEKMGWRVVGNG